MSTKMSEPYTDIYITKAAESFIEELTKIEHLKEEDHRKHFDRLISQYDNLFVEKFVKAQGEYKHPAQPAQTSGAQNPYFEKTIPLMKTAFVADGKFDTNVQKMAASMNNPYMQTPLSQMDPNSISFAGHNIGFSKSPEAFQNPAGFNAPQQSKGNVLGLHPEQQLNFDLHANSKHYHPKDSEYFNEDIFAKPGKGFYGNQQAVRMNMHPEDRPDEFEHPLEAQVMQNRLRQQMGYPPMGPNAWENNQTLNMPKYPLPQMNDLQFNPQIANTQHQNDANLQKNVAMIGGITPMIPGMEKSLLENEMRYISMNKNASRPNAGFLGHEAPNLAAHQTAMNMQQFGMPDMSRMGAMGEKSHPHFSDIPPMGHPSPQHNQGIQAQFLQTEYLKTADLQNHFGGAMKPEENPQFAQELNRTRLLRAQKEKELDTMHKMHGKMDAYGNILKRSVEPNRLDWSGK